MGEIIQRYKSIVAGKSKFKRFLFYCTLSPFGIIIYNLALLSCVLPICFYKYPLSDRKVTFIGLLNILTLTYTLILLVMRLALIDCNEMRKDLFTFFDLGIILLSYIEIAISYSLNNVVIPSALASLFVLKIVV